MKLIKLPFLLSLSLTLPVYCMERRTQLNTESHLSSFELLPPEIRFQIGQLAELQLKQEVFEWLFNNLALTAANLFFSDDAQCLLKVNQDNTGEVFNTSDLKNPIRSFGNVFRADFSFDNKNFNELEKRNKKILFMFSKNDPHYKQLQNFTCPNRIFHLNKNRLDDESTRKVTLFQTSNLKPIKIFDSVSFAIFSPNSKFLFIKSVDSQMGKLFNLSDPENLIPITIYTSLLNYEVEFSPDSRFLICKASCTISSCDIPDKAMLIPLNILQQIGYLTTEQIIFLNDFYNRVIKPNKKISLTEHGLAILGSLPEEIQHICTKTFR